MADRGRGTEHADCGSRLCFQSEDKTGQSRGGFQPGVKDSKKKKSEFEKPTTRKTTSRKGEREKVGASQAGKGRQGTVKGETTTAEPVAPYQKKTESKQRAQHKIQRPASLASVNIGTDILLFLLLGKGRRVQTRNQHARKRNKHKGRCNRQVRARKTRENLVAHIGGWKKVVRGWGRSSNVQV